jgi:iron uptake system component EfeO
MYPVRLAVTAAMAVPALVLATGCTAKSDSDDAAAKDAIKVTATDKSCETSAKSAPAGHVTLDITNKGSRATEVEILFPDDRILSEKENIGPGTHYTLTAEVKAGSYEIACVPGMKGKGIRQELTVTGKGAVKHDPRLDKAVAGYRSYVQAQADAAVPLVETFVKAVQDGDVEAAKKAYAPSRMGWERTEPVAESFGDIDAKADTREDGLEQGQKWTGWHALEKSLWENGKITSADKTLAAGLLDVVKDWDSRIGTAEITPTSIANGSKELLDEVATGKVTGEEERYSHTDLADFKANVEGAEKGYDLLKPVVKENDGALATELDKQFAALNSVIDSYRTGPAASDFRPYDKVGQAERKKLSDQVNALSEPLSRLAAAVVK